MNTVKLILQPKFTEGEWTTEKCPEDNCYTYINGLQGNEMWHAFASVVTRMSGDEQDKTEGLANAQLIKTAPKLFYALIDLANWMQAHGDIPPELTHAQEVIQEAITIETLRNT